MKVSEFFTLKYNICKVIITITICLYFCIYFSKVYALVSEEHDSEDYTFLLLLSCLTKLFENSNATNQEKKKIDLFDLDFV